MLVNPRRKDESGLTAVIEFLTAFVLFLMIVTAFLSLAQLQLGSNQPSMDRLEIAAIDSLQQLTDSEGLFVPLVDGFPDYENSTSDWHLLNAQTLIQGNLLPGLLDERGLISQSRINALGNITEGQVSRGIGLENGFAIHLRITVLESENESRIGVNIFEDGPARNTSQNSASSSRMFKLNNEKIIIVLDVLDGASKFAKLEFTEFMVQPSSGGPEWVELYNPNSFAVNLSGWALAKESPNSPNALHLFTTGVVSGGSVILLSGNPTIQSDLGAESIFDLFQSGVLGSGQNDLIDQYEGKITLTWAEYNSASAVTVSEVNWDFSWSIGQNDALNYLGGDMDDSSNWNYLQGGTPGKLGDD